MLESPKRNHVGRNILGITRSSLGLILGRGLSFFALSFQVIWKEAPSHSRISGGITFSPEHRVEENWQNTTDGELGEIWGLERQLRTQMLVCYRPREVKVFQG